MRIQREGTISIQVKGRSEILAALPWVAELSGKAADRPACYGCAIWKDWPEKERHQCKVKARWVYAFQDGSVGYFCSHHIFDGTWIHGEGALLKEYQRSDSWLKHHSHDLH